MSIVHISFYPSDWLAGTRGLSAEETGVYITLVSRIYEMAGAIERDDNRLSRLCGCKSKAAFVKALEYLISEGKIIEVDGLLSNERAQKEIEKTTEKSSKAREAAESRWNRKANKNKAGVNADASPKHMRTGCQSEPEPELLKKEAKASQKKGSHLPDDWTPSEKNIQDAQACGLTNDEVRHEADKFRDYWISKPGAGGRKSDWDATWRNWCRKSREGKSRGGYQQPRHPLAQAFDELRSDIRRAENRSEFVPSGQAEHDGGTVIELTAVGGRNTGRGEAHGGGCPDDGDNPLRLFPSERFR